MNTKHRQTLQEIFKKPVPKNLAWGRIEALFVALGAKVFEGDGSRVAFELKGVTADFHRPHPGKEAKPYVVRNARAFLESVGVEP
ncbi:MULTISPECIES: type II toxin-antitoxin system HicA family toxin [unclassified Pseudomonas]|uniref:type II toxin-antitoxin system HicA family toxin n=1 Tax=unclassified Pseudomonas TaxID=196821 RepID=UPI001C60CF31|nr:MULTISPECIES: type II toxin-antitoxin system HicA family toxin [unclassified Pseudomonas]MBW5416085.1 addiction module toxin, HicA family [Pseudomonas sp. MAG002Y]